jgi:hypothetical protein
MKKLIIVFFMMLSGVVFAQEEKSDTHTSKIRGAIMMGNSRIPHAYEGGKSVTVIPVWGFDLDYYFHQRLSVGLQADIKLQSFEVEEESTVILERNHPVSLALVGHYHALRNWSFYAGPGIELEQSENLFLLKVGTEYSFEISEQFEIALNLIYENRNEIYDGFTFGVAFNKLLWKKSK